MTTEHQLVLRDALLRVILPELQADRVTPVEAAIAAAGACSICCGLLPTPEVRAVLVEQIKARLLEMTEHRATQIRSGAIDDDLERREQ